MEKMVAVPDKLTLGYVEYAVYDEQKENELTDFRRKSFFTAS